MWFISFFLGNNWCVWSWRESNIRTIDTCGYPGNIKRSYQYITNLLNPPRSLWDTRQQQALPFIPSLCSTLCQTLSEFYLGELSHNSLIWQEADWSVCFCLMVSPHIFVEKACFDKGRIVGHMIEWSFGFSCWKYVAAYGLLNRRVIFCFLFLRRKSCIPSAVLMMSEKQYFNKRSAVNQTFWFPGLIPFAVEGWILETRLRGGKFRLPKNVTGTHLCYISCALILDGSLFGCIRGNHA